MKHNITLHPGDTLLVTVSHEIRPPPEPSPDELDILLTIGSVNIYRNRDASYVSFVSNLDICNDGCGPAHGDKYHQSMTAYYSGGIEGNKYLNADVDKYIVIPPQIRSMVPGVVMGCRGRVTNLKTKVMEEGVIGEIGPDDKTGETAYVLAKLINPKISYNSGDSDKEYLYELWPDVPATVDGFTYKLQPA
jgi:Fungal chitosanase of glycosyl hydrolase group 75